VSSTRGTTSRITPSTESKILEEFVADLWKISRWVSVGDNSPELILYGLLWSSARGGIQGEHDMAESRGG
jgi:hypothetical protein